MTTEASRTDAVQRVLDTVWRMESGRLVAALTRIVRDVGTAEDLAHDALEAALRQWPEAGIPDNPGAWLMATARHRAVDGIRRQVTLERKAEELGRDIIHSVTNPISRHTGALHVYGGGFFGVKRSEWDPETLQERPFDLEDAVRRFREANERFESVR